MAHITATYIQQYFDAQSAEQSSKLSVFLSSLMDTPQEEVQKALKEVAKINSTLKVRCSEVRQIWGALHYADMSMDSSIGYNRASAEARELLKVKGIKWNGEAIKTKEERAEQAARDAATTLAAEALQSVGYDVSKIADGLTKIKEDRFMSGLEKYLQSAIDSGVTTDVITLALQSAIESLTVVTSEERTLRAA